MKVLGGEDLVGGYGGRTILQGCAIRVESGEIVVIVGPNGAGKSTAMKAIFGMIDLDRGRIMLDDRNITGLSMRARVQEGMAFVPQTANVFAEMTVEENLEMGAFLRDDDISGTMEQVFELFPVLRDKRRQLAGGAPYMRVCVIGVILLLVLRFSPGGLIPASQRLFGD